MARGGGSLNELQTRIRLGERDDLGLAVLVAVAFRADVIDESSSLQNVFDEALLDIHGERWTPQLGENSMEEEISSPRR